jgi:hypothetical protein
MNTSTLLSFSIAIGKVILHYLLLAELWSSEMLLCCNVVLISIDTIPVQLKALVNGSK